MTRTLIRSLRRWDLNAVAIAFSLGIGLAVYVLAWTIVNAAVFRSYPGVTKQNRLAQIWTAERSRDQELPPDVLRSLLPASGVASHMPVRMTVDLGRGAELMPVAFVSPNYFETLGVRLVSGRSLRDTESPAAIISYGLWQSRWQSSKDALGSLITVDGTPATVLGIAPQGFVGASRYDMPTSTHPGTSVWLSSGILDLIPRQSIPAVGWVNRSYFARMIDGASLADLDARVKAISAPGFTPRAQTKDDPRAVSRAVAVRFNDPGDPQVQSLIAATFLGPTVVLLLCCLNTASLIAIRYFRRVHELSLRMALGASARHVVGACFGEAAALAACSWLVAAPVLVLGMRVVQSAVAFPLKLDLHVWTVATVVTLLAGVGSALGPVSSAVRAAGRGSLFGQGQGARPNSKRRWLLAGQVALAVALLGTTAQFSATLSQLGRSTASLGAAELAVASIDLTQVPPLDRRGRVEELLRRLQGIPGVTSSAKSSHAVPWALRDQPGGLFVSRASEARSLGRWRPRSYVTPDFLSASGMKLLSGRWFTADEFTDAVPRVAIVDAELARILFGSPAGIGTVTIGASATSPGTDLRVVGAVEAPAGEIRTTIYLPAPLTEEGLVDILVRFTSATTVQLDRVRQTIRDFDTRVAIDSLGTLSDLQDVAADGPSGRRTVAMVGTMSLLAVIVALVGVAGTTLNLVVQRRREVGIRLALGSPPARIVWLFAKDALRIGLVGGVAGVAVAKLGEHFIRGRLYGVAGLNMAVATAVALSIVLLIAATALGSVVFGVRGVPIAAIRSGNRSD